MCDFKLFFCANPFLHILHTKGFTPVWTRTWISIWERYLNFIPHTLHVNWGIKPISSWLSFWNAAWWLVKTLLLASLWPRLYTVKRMERTVHSKINTHQHNNFARITIYKRTMYSLTIFSLKFKYTNWKKNSKTYCGKITYIYICNWCPWHAQQLDTSRKWYYCGPVQGIHRFL